MSATTTEPTDAEAQAFLDSLIGPLGEPVQVQVELGAVRRMALCLNDLDPIHFNEAGARARGYRGIVAPWPLLWLYFFTCTIYEHDFPFGKATVHGADEYEFHEPMVVGDVLTVTTAMVEAKIKHGKSGRLGQVVSERRFTNQRGELCAVLRTILFRR